MKKSITFIRTNIMLLTLIVACFSVNISAQTNSLQLAATKPELPAYFVVVGGSYPASGTLVQALSTIKTDSVHKTIITQGSAVHFTAREKIILKPGFKAVNGSKFIADIKPYSPAGQTQNLALANNITAGHVSVSPNPFNNTFIISVNAEKSSLVQIAVYSSAGVKVKERQNLSLAKGLNSISFNGASLSSGAYLIEVKFDDLKFISKIVKY